ncbi:MAG: T9SS type A sorting domain-containing protein [Saprospiraceae bacterium]|nr:T9SS type A sorting domain-containing protein [Saprospiraceae bacterium]
MHKLRYSVSPLAFPQKMLLDSFAYAFDFYNDFYFNGNYYWGLLSTIYSRDESCFSTANYRDRDFYHIVTNSDGNDTIDGADSLQVFNTLNFPNDSYIFRVTASDPSGNTTIDSMIVTIKNGTVSLPDITMTGQISAYPNPFSFATNLKIKSILNDATLTMYNVYGQAIKQIKIFQGQKLILVVTIFIAEYISYD